MLLINLHGVSRTFLNLALSISEIPMRVSLRLVNAEILQTSFILSQLNSTFRINDRQ